MTALASIVLTLRTCCCILQVGMLLGDLMEGIEQRALSYAQKEEISCEKDFLIKESEFAWS